MDQEDLFPRVVVGGGYPDYLVEAARPQQGWVDHVDPIGRGQDDDPLEGAYPVELCQELADDPLRHLVVTAHPPRRRYRITLVEEYYTRGGLSCSPEDLSHPPLRFADPLAKELGPPHADEIGLAFGRHRLGQERLSSPGRTEEQDPFWHVVPYRLVKVREL